MSKHVSLICYIGNGIVKGSVVLNEKNKLPTILATRVRELPYQEFVDRKHLESRVMSEFTSLITDIKFKDLAGAKFRDACVILSSPWYVSKTKTVKIDHEKPFEITEKIINDAIASAALEYSEKPKEGVTILEKNVSKYYLNGYPTNVPLKKTAQRVEMSVFLSFCETKTVDLIKQTMLSHLNIHDTQIHSQSLAAFAAVQETWKDLANYVLTDISSQLTELMIVRQETLAEAASFPLGKQYVLKELGSIFNTSGDVSRSLLEMYHKGTIEPSLKSKVEEAISMVKKEWLKPFTNALSEMSAGSSLPSRFILFAPKDAEWLFADFIKSEEYQQFTFSEGKFEVYESKVSDFEHLYNLTAGVTPDISLAVGAIFFHKKIKGVI